MKRKYYRKRDNNFYLDKTKEEILSEIDYDNPKTFVLYLEILDYPYLEHEWNKCLQLGRERNLNNIFDSVDRLVSNNTYVKYRLWVNSVYRDSIIDKLNNKYNVIIDDQKELKLANNVYFEVEEEFIWPNLDNDYYTEIGSCMGCRTHIGVLVDGTVVPCCLDSNGIINLGNIYKDNLSDIINGDLFQTIKNGFLNNKKCHELCRRCNFYDLRR